MHREACTEQLAQPKTSTKQLAQSILNKTASRKQLARSTCAKPIVQRHLRPSSQSCRRALRTLRSYLRLELRCSSWGCLVCYEFVSKQLRLLSWSCEGALRRRPHILCEPELRERASHAAAPSTLQTRTGPAARALREARPKKGVRQEACKFARPQQEFSDTHDSRRGFTECLANSNGTTHDPLRGFDRPALCKPARRYSESSGKHDLRRHDRLCSLLFHLATLRTLTSIRAVSTVGFASSPTKLGSLDDTIGTYSYMCKAQALQKNHGKNVRGSDCNRVGCNCVCCSEILSKLVRCLANLRDEERMPVVAEPNSHECFLQSSRPKAPGKIIMTGAQEKRLLRNPGAQFLSRRGFSNRLQIRSEKRFRPSEGN